MQVIESFVRRTVAAAPGSSLAAVGCLMDEHNVGAVVIAEGRRPVGIVTDRDLALALTARGLSPEAPVTKAMSSPVTTMYCRAGVFAATQAMKEANVRRLPVVDDEDFLVGIVTFDDLVGVLGRELNNLVETLQPETHVRFREPEIVPENV